MTETLSKFTSPWSDLLTLVVHPSRRIVVVLMCTQADAARMVLFQTDWRCKWRAHIYNLYIVLIWEIWGQNSRWLWDDFFHNFLAVTHYLRAPWEKPAGFGVQRHHVAYLITSRNPRPFFMESWHRAQDSWQAAGLQVKPDTSAAPADKAAHARKNDWRRCTSMITNN